MKSIHSEEHALTFPPKPHLTLLYMAQNKRISMWLDTGIRKNAVHFGYPYSIEWLHGSASPVSVSAACVSSGVNYSPHETSVLSIRGYNSLPVCFAPYHQHASYPSGNRATV